MQVVTEQGVIEEYDMEVTDLMLSDDECQLLATKYGKCFTEDAMTALTSNYETNCNHTN